MGIKFHCPNGHKLNVKSFLGGKRAICPKCGARVIVPSEGAADSSDPGSSSIALTAVETGTGASSIIVSAGAGPSPAQTAASDPISEDPSAVWFVRPATGGQFGPASGEIMCGWVAEGRVGASSLVWRAGWSEWRAASAIFPQLAAMLASPGIAVGPTHTVPARDAIPIGPDNGLPVGTSLRAGQPVQSGADVSGMPIGAAPSMPPIGPVMRRRRSNPVGTLVTVGLVVATIFLAVTLYFVFPRQETPPEATSNASGTSTTPK